MKHSKLPDELHVYLEVNADSPSGLIWIQKPFRSQIEVGGFAGTKHRTGYWQVSFKRSLYLAHRIVYFLSTGEDPGEFFIDHIENKNNNLAIRLCSKNQNKANAKKQSTYAAKPTSSRFKGVCYRQKENKWHAYITDNKIKKHLGFFDSEIAAAMAYNSAALQIFGEFAILNNL
jgi:AP2 domain